MKSQLNAFLKKFCDHITKIKDCNQSWIITKVVPYIQEHYNNTNLNVAEIAEHFDHHSVYLSKLFKEQVGEGILDYLNRIRVEKSKLLLEEKKWTL